MQYAARNCWKALPCWTWGNFGKVSLQFAVNQYDIRYEYHITRSQPPDHDVLRFLLHFTAPCVSRCVSCVTTYATCYTHRQNLVFMICKVTEGVQLLHFAQKSNNNKTATSTRSCNSYLRHLTLLTTNKWGVPSSTTIEGVVVYWLQLFRPLIRSSSGQM
jgi:hypothetical protein